MTERELQDLLHRHTSVLGVPGAAAGLLHGGHVTTACVGVADVRTDEPVTAESRFGVGSLTKSMCATVIARLAAAGRLSLEDRIAAHVPELRGAAWAESATTRDLLANRSGLPLRSRLEFGFDKHETGTDDVLARFAASVAVEESTPVEWSYTNAGWCVAGRIIETVTGDRWEDAVHEHLFRPAAMWETGARSPHRITGHEPASGGAVPVEPLDSCAFGPAGTSLVSTVGDMLRFAGLHLADPALEVMRRAQPSPAIRGWFDGWCLGWARFDADGGPIWGWDSVLPGERAVLRLLPEHDTAVAVMTNSDAGRALCRPVLREVLASFGIGLPPLRLDPRSGSAGDLARFEAVYGWPDRRVEVRAAEKHLVVSGEDGDVAAWPLDERAFVVDAADPDNPAITFEAFDPTGRPNILYLMLWGLPRLDC